jgi:hypothetical protein
MCENEIPPDHQFRPDLKCCSYRPQLSNFQVGLILTDSSPEAAQGRAAIARQVSSRHGATPLGISPPQFFLPVVASRQTIGGNAPSATEIVGPNDRLIDLRTLDDS